MLFWAFKKTVYSMPFAFSYKINIKIVFMTLGIQKNCNVYLQTLPQVPSQSCLFFIIPFLYSLLLILVCNSVLVFCKQLNVIMGVGN